MTAIYLIVQQPNKNENHKWYLAVEFSDIIKVLITPVGLKKRLQIKDTIYKTAFRPTATSNDDIICYGVAMFTIHASFHKSIMRLIISIYFAPCQSLRMSIWEDL